MKWLKFEQEYRQTHDLTISLNQTNPKRLLVQFLSNSMQSQSDFHCPNQSAHVLSTESELEGEMSDCLMMSRNFGSRFRNTGQEYRKQSRIVSNSFPSLVRLLILSSLSSHFEFLVVRVAESIVSEYLPSRFISRSIRTKRNAEYLPRG